MNIRKRTKKKGIFKIKIFYKTINIWRLQQKPESV